MFFGRFMEFALILSLWPFVIGPSFVNNSWKNRITTMINQCSLTRFQTAPPLFLDQTEARRAEKNFFETTPPPLSQGLDDRVPPLSGPPLQAIMVEQLVKFCFLKAWCWFLLLFFFFSERQVHIICVQESEACFLVSWVSFFLLSCWSTFLPAAVLKEPWTILLGKMFQKNSMFIR